MLANFFYSAMKSVCIIGAGPGGLVAAKTFLETRRFRVTIYEQSAALGGLWRFDPGALGNKYLSASTPTNLSRYTVGFSDLAWDSIPLDGPLSMFPKAPQVGQYLQEYARRYVPKDTVRYGTRVTAARRLGKSWEITTTAAIGANASMENEKFDYLIVAAGFYADPVPLDPTQIPIPAHGGIRAIHSADFKTLTDLFPDPSQDVRNTTIAVVGGGNSGGEAAAAVAFQLSDSEQAPVLNERFQGVKVVHSIKRPFYPIPPYIPAGPAPTFAPLDLQFYDLKWRPAEVIRSSSGKLSAEATQHRHMAMRGMSGDQADLGASALQYLDKDQETFAPYAALTEAYPDFVRPGTGLITPHFCADGNVTIDADVSAIVYATGYSPMAALSFLSEDVKSALEFDATSPRLPLLLQNWQTSNPSVPNLGFVGFYEGPYWGVMEMQARLLAKMYSEDFVPPSHPDEDFAQLRALRTAMQSREPAIPQYWFSDYVAYLEELSRVLGLQRNDTPFPSSRKGPVAAARYLAPHTTVAGRLEAETTMRSLAATVAAVSAGRFRARAVMRGLQGKWNLTRTLQSERDDMPSGIFNGAAWFHPRQPTDAGVDREYLYIEHGTFRTTTGITMSASRRYVWRYGEERDELVVWFVQVDAERAADYEFHALQLAPADAPSQPEGSITATAEHFCEPDWYRTSYAFHMAAVRVVDFDVRHVVTGPAKDYVSTARYTREAVV